MIDAIAVASHIKFLPKVQILSLALATLSFEAGASDPNTDLLAHFEAYQRQAITLDQTTTSPAAEFFTLVMLEQLAGGTTKEKLAGLTGLERWRSRGGAGAGVVRGWRKLESNWWIDQMLYLTAYGEEVARAYRTKTQKFDFFGGNLGGQGAPPRVFEGLPRYPESTMLTEARIAPQIEGGLVVVRGGMPKEFDSTTVRFLQTGIVKARCHETDGKWTVGLPLAGGGEVVVSNSRIMDLSMGKKRDVIVFIPKGTATSIYSMGKRISAEGILGSGSNYGKMVDRGLLVLSEWKIQTEVAFEAHEAEASQISGKGEQPLVVHIDLPFYFRIEGREGELLFEGEVSEGGRGGREDN
jgi:hypothetical protein